MKVIHILHELKFSGAEIMYVDAAPIFKELGCDLYVMNTTPKLGEYASSFRDAGYKILHWPYPNSLFARFKYYEKFIRFLKEEKIDVVHIHSSNMKWGMSYCAWRAKCKAIYTFHNVFQSHWYSYLYHFWLRQCAKHFFGCTFQTISDSVYENEKNITTITQSKYIIGMEVIGFTQHNLMRKTKLEMIYTYHKMH